MEEEAVPFDKRGIYIDSGYACMIMMCGRETRNTAAAICTQGRDKK
jgi:hypothetical protein